jgi:hypothetical protein
VSIPSPSFWQQDNNWRIRQQSRSLELSGSNAAASAIAGALTSQSAGIAGIANQAALNRVAKQLEAAATAALQSSKSGGKSAGNSSGAITGPAILSASGILPSSATNLQSSVTAESVLSSALSSESLGSGLGGVLNGGLVNILA